MSNLIYLTDHELAVVLANLKASPLPTQAGPVWRKIVRQVGHGELVGGEHDPNPSLSCLACNARIYGSPQYYRHNFPMCSQACAASSEVHPAWQEYDPNFQAESRQGEPK